MLKMHRIIFVLLVALVSCRLDAQEVTGNISGTVVDSSGAAVTNAAVNITATAQGMVLRALQTNEIGIYSATLLPVGTYSVTVEAPGFKRARLEGIALSANDKYRADFKLEVGGVSQEVTVEAPPLQVELQTAQI